MEGTTSDAEDVRMQTTVPEMTFVISAAQGRVHQVFDEGAELMLVLAAIAPNEVAMPC